MNRIAAAAVCALIASPSFAAITRDELKKALDANPDLEPADAFTQMRCRHLDQALDNLDNDLRTGSRNCSGQMLNIAREYARLAEGERTKRAETDPKMES